MQRLSRWILWGFIGLLALPLLALALLIGAANTSTGLAEIERAVSVLSANQIVLNGLGGDLPAQLTVKRIELRDAGGPWLTIDELILDWLPAKLLVGEVAIERLQVRKIAVARPPVPSVAAEPETSGGLSLPLAINVNNLLVERVEMAPPLAGKAIDLSVGGGLALTTAFRGAIELKAKQLDGEGTYSVQAKLSNDSLQARLSLHETARGPLALLAGLHDREGLSLEASLAGPLSGVLSSVDLKLDELQAQLGGRIDFVQPGADLSLTASAPAMQLRPDLAWRALSLNLQMRGALKDLAINADLQLDGLHAAQTDIGNLDVKWQGIGGRIDLDGELAGLQLADSQTDLLQATPLAFQAKMGWDTPDYPVDFVIKHPLIDASGHTHLEKGGGRAELALNLPDLRPLAAANGLQLEGHGMLTLKAARQADGSKLEIAGILGLSGGSSWARLLGESAKFDLSMAGEKENMTLSWLQLDGKALSLSAHGELDSGNADFEWQAQLNDVSAIADTASGKLAIEGSLNGERDDLTLEAKLNGNLKSQGYPGGPIKAALQLQHLPDAPDGRINLNGELIGSPIEVRLAVDSPGGKTIRLDIDQADWKSTRASGGLTLTRDNSPPAGKIVMKINRLADFRPLLGQPLSGSADATLELGERGGRPLAKIGLEARNAGLEGTATAETSSLALTVSEPTTQARLDGLLTLNGISAGKISGSARLKMEGAMDSLHLGLSAISPNLNGSAAQLSAAAQLNAAGSVLAVSAMEASWRQQTVRLLAPAKIAFAEGLSVDRLRLGLRQAELEIAGKFTPELALNAELHETPAELISLFAPDLAMNGTLHASAELAGSLAQPKGLFRFQADKLQMKQGPGRGLPPARIDVTASIHGEVAELDAKLNVGNDTRVQISGQLPMTQTGLLNLQGEAALDLKQLNPLLSADGRRMRGLLRADAKLVGTWPAPVVTMNAHLDGGDWQDAVAGVSVKDIAAELQAENGTLRIVKLQGRAGSGTLAAAGSVGLSTAGFPVDLTVTARNAKPLASDRLTVNLDADLAVRGLAVERLNVDGRIRINRADIRIPERMPTSIAVLKLNNPAAPPPAPEAKGDIALNLMVDAPREIFVRGRGLDAELGGTVHIAGTLKELRPDGTFHQRRGEFSLAGQSLVFNQGEVGFDSGSLTNPSLNFVATTSRNNIAASLTVGGSAQQPKITLSSTPQLPQDEILANLLFGKGSASLSPLEMVQIASTLASLTGVTGGGQDPLESARKRLGLDRLSAGGANPSVEGGRYIAPGVYLGAKQGVSGGTPQAVIQIDVLKGLKLESTIGNVGGIGGTSSSGNSSTNSIGVLYQFEY
ncbi:Inner membrane component of TAM transport system [Methylomonas albis]|uniref:Translocation/assembly module TamB domain-containing protein n=1 Tax=Methylomonas albis TaxID=1854563 RepID=A0ABR9D0A3_9GAMM|nr:translocation/assembly module TamB domain-containing protein [Methylomonas albis]MBD9356507.1 translocation/assembly module TamB domain-containing protein [Methylomonas albis]CAD6879621.1 Inner membrane component of TAM transport system [Methylomonas albis]